MAQRRTFWGGVSALLGGGKTGASPPPTFPPVPAWRPSFGQPLDRLAETLRYYSDGKRDFAMFEHGTCVTVEDGLSDAEVRTAALDTLSKIFHFHADMHPSPMDDGNILIRYNHPAVNIVLADIAKGHWPEIEARYLDGLATAEVILTPGGSNNFDDFGKQALLGRCYMFMDAQAPKIVRIVRRG